MISWVSVLSLASDVVVEVIDSDSILSSDEVVTETDSDSVVVSPVVVVSLSEVSEVSEQGLGYNTLSFSSKQQCSLFGWSSCLLKH